MKILPHKIYHIKRVKMEMLQIGGDINLVRHLVDRVEKSGEHGEHGEHAPGTPKDFSRNTQGKKLSKR